MNVKKEETLMSADTVVGGIAIGIPLVGVLILWLCCFAHVFVDYYYEKRTGHRVNTVGACEHDPLCAGPEACFRRQRREQWKVS